MRENFRGRLTYANVMVTILAFVVLAGGTAYAAAHLGKNSVGPKQLRKNAVTTAKIKKNAVTAAKVRKNAINAAKIKNGSVNSDKVADGSLTGGDVNASTMPFSQIVARLGSSSQVAFSESGEPALYPLGAYTQPVGEVDQMIGSVSFEFGAGCEPERVAQVLLLIDPPAKLAEASPTSIIGFGLIQDKGSGASTRTVQIGPYPVPGGGTMTNAAPSTATTHSYGIALIGSCDSGSGVTAQSVTLDVIGTK